MPHASLRDIRTVVSEPLNFKAKLAIGEDAYATLRLKNAVGEAWDTLGAAGTGAAVAKSAFIANMFFAQSGLWGILGLGAAATPLGWIVAAGVVTGGAWIGVTRYVRSKAGSNVTVIPKFINTPLDVLALGLFDLMAPLALKIAAIDGSIDDAERLHIERYFVRGWGYSADFVAAGLNHIEEHLDEFSIREAARTLAEFKKGNPDCNYAEMSREMVAFLREIIEADGIIDEREEMALESIERVFEEEGKLHIGKAIRGGVAQVSESLSSAGNAIAGSASEGARKLTALAKGVSNGTSSVLSKALKKSGQGSKKNPQ